MKSRVTMKAVTVVLALAVPSVFSGELSAADKTCSTTMFEWCGQNVVIGGPFWNFLKEVNLNDGQKAKVEKLAIEVSCKLSKAVDSVLTADQKKAHDEAQKKAHDEAQKKARGEAIKATNNVEKKGTLVLTYNVVKLTDKQKTKILETLTPLEKELREKTFAILTSEQQAKLKAKMEEHKAESK